MTHNAQSVALVKAVLEGENPKDFLRHHAATQADAGNNVTLEANPSDAPCCVKVVHDDGRDILFQTDYDWPSVASHFGWDISTVNQDRGCNHEGTDGTINCEMCHTTASDFIGAARDWIDDNDGARADDPGWFAVEESEDPKDFFRQRLAQIAKEHGQKRYSEYQFRDHGIENCQYWQGAGTSYTSWSDVYTGVGDNPKEAAEDALEQAAMDGWVVDNINDEFPTEPSVSGEYEAERAEQRAAREAARAERDAEREEREQQPSLFPEIDQEDEEAADTADEEGEEEENDDEGPMDLYYYVTLWFKEMEPPAQAQQIVADALQEGAYLTRLAWYKRAKDKNQKMRDVAKAQREIENIDKPDKKRKRLNLH